MKKLFTLVAIALLGGAVSVNAQTTDWNFSNWEQTTLTSTYTQDGLTIYANSDADVTIDGNKKSIDGVDYTQRLKLGGAGTFDDNGTPSARVIAFDVAGDCTIYMALMSSSSSAIRTVYVDANVNGTKINVATYNDVQGESIESRTINYTGDAGTIYIYSKSGGVNFYDIKYTPGTSSGITNITTEPNSFASFKLLNCSFLQVVDFSVQELNRSTAFNVVFEWKSVKLIKFVVWCVK